MKPSSTAIIRWALAWGVRKASARIMTEFFSRFGTRAGWTNTLRYLCNALAIVLSMVLLLGQPTSAFAQGDLAPDVARHRASGGSCGAVVDRCFA